MQGGCHLRSWTSLAPNRSYPLVMASSSLKWMNMAHLVRWFNELRYEMVMFHIFFCTYVYQRVQNQQMIRHCLASTGLAPLFGQTVSTSSWILFVGVTMHKRKEGPAKGMKEQMDTFSPNETWAWFLLFFLQWDELSLPNGRCSLRHNDVKQGRSNKSPANCDHMLYSPQVLNP